MVHQTRGFFIDSYSHLSPKFLTKSAGIKEIYLFVKSHDFYDVLRPRAGLLSIDEMSGESSDVELGRLPADHIPPSLRHTEYPVRLLLLGEDSVPDIHISQGSVVGFHPMGVHQDNVLRKHCYCYIVCMHRGTRSSLNLLVTFFVANLGVKFKEKVKERLKNHS